MSKICCNVHTCLHNVQGGCALPGIRIGGQTAQKSAGTMCNSFEEKTSGAQNSVCGRCGDSSVACRAENCYYNDRCVCAASSVDVGGVGACDCRDTRCETFVRK